MTVIASRGTVYDQPEPISQARAGISTCIDFYSSRRPRRAHGGRTPDVVYFDSLPQTKAAA